MHNDGANGSIEARFLLRYGSAESAGFVLDVDLVLPGSGVTAIFGQSGSGKTTLLRCIAGLERAGLERAEQGRLRVNDTLWQDDSLFLPTHQRPLGYVFQEASLFPHLTAQGNLNYAIRRSGQPRQPDLEQRVVALLGIAPILAHYPAQLSGGERQRVAIARALLLQPRLLLMDEPLASLDFARKQEILPYLERLHAAIDLPILYVSHSMEEVTRLADHVVLLQHGRAVAQGSVNAVFSRIDLPLPLEEDAGVIWRGRVVERDARWHLARVACAGGELWVRDAGDEIGREIRVRILARDISLALANHTDSSLLNRLPVEVVEVAADEDDALTMVRLKAGSDYLLAQLTRRSADHLQLRPGQQLWSQIKSVALIR